MISSIYNCFYISFYISFSCRINEIKGLPTPPPKKRNIRGMQQKNEEEGFLFALSLSFQLSVF